MSLVLDYFVTRVTLVGLLPVCVTDNVNWLGLSVTVKGVHGQEHLVFMLGK